MSDAATIAFIKEHIRSVWALEQLLLMRREPRAWTPDELVRELRSARPLVETNLEAFTRAGVLRAEGDGAWRYAPANALLSQLIDDIAGMYRARPVSFINALFSDDRLQELANAFKFRQDPK